MCPIYPNISSMYVKHVAPRLFVFTCLSDIHAHSYVHHCLILLHKTSLSCLCVYVALDISQTANLSQCSSTALYTSHLSPTVTRWLSVGACQGLCGLHRAVRHFPFPGALGAPLCLAPAWPQRTVFMSCVIADLSLSRRPVSVKIAVHSLQARPKSHQLPQ